MHWSARALALLCLAAAVSSAQPAGLVTYSEDSSNFPNPERGFYRQRAPMWLGTDRSGLASSDLATFRAEGITVLRAYYIIDEFRDAPLSAEMLAALDADFATVRAAGLKIIPRFAYNFPLNWPVVEPDAALTRVLDHIGQLAAALQANTDVIAFVETGFVGAWGEWHHSTNGLVAADNDANASSSAIIDALLAAVPVKRALAIRYPHVKRKLYGASPLTVSEAFTGTAKARIGAHNDCFLVDAIDGGTYTVPPNFTPAIETIKGYLNEDNRFVPQGGETCGADATAQPYIACTNALADLARMRWSTINLEYHPDVIAGWQAQGCFADVQKRLGYRLRLVSSDLPAAVRQGRSFTASFTIANSGFAAPYNPRTVELILRHVGTGVVHRIAIAADPRLWGPGANHSFTGTLSLPNGISAGVYQVLLNLPDPETSLRNRPEYSVRLANTGTWQADTGFNSLLRTITVTEPPAFTDPVLMAGTTSIKAIHVLELRTRIDAVRSARGLSLYAWTDTSLAGVTVTRAHLLELRSALAAAYVAAGVTPPAYSEEIIATVTPIRTTHIQELRAAVVAIE
jgi:hypothetical protein